MRERRGREERGAGDERKGREVVKGKKMKGNKGPLIIQKKRKKKGHDIVFVNGAATLQTRRHNEEGKKERKT